MSMSKSKSQQVTKATPSRKPTKPTPAARSRRRGQQSAAQPPLPEVLQTSEFSAAWADWQRWHTEHGTALTVDDAARQLEMLARLGPDAAIADIRKTLQEHVPAGDPTPLVAVPPVEIAAPAAEGGGEPATATPGEVAATVTTMTSEVMTSEIMTNEVMANEIMASEVMASEVMASEIMASTLSPTADPASTGAEPEPVAVEVTLPPHAIAQPAPAAATEPTALRASTTAALPTGPLSALDAAAQVLAAAGQSLTCQQLIERMAAQGLWSSPKGKTPAGTLYSSILREQATKGDQARFVKTGRGQFAYRGAV